MTDFVFFVLLLVDMWCQVRGLPGADAAIRMVRGWF